MIRTVIGLFVFAVILCAWIVIRPGPQDPSADIAAIEAEVDRLGAGASAVQDVEVTRSEPAQVETFQPALRQVTRVIPEAPSIRTGEETLSQTTAGILSGLGLETATPAVIMEDDLGQMTSGILSSIRAVTGEQPMPREPSALSELVIEALQAGQTDAAIDNLVNAAATAGDIAVPDILVTPEGRVDTSVLLANIISEARVASGQPAPDIPDAGIGGEGVEVRVVQTADETEQFRFYTVNSGDSLGSIAIKFYGVASYYPRIFDANRVTLSSPDRIRVGQRLVIPQL